jgi:hypothetical protein
MKAAPRRLQRSEPMYLLRLPVYCILIFFLQSRLPFRLAFFLSLSKSMFVFVCHRTALIVKSMHELHLHPHITHH